MRGMLPLWRYRRRRRKRFSQEKRRNGDERRQWLFDWSARAARRRPWRQELQIQAAQQRLKRFVSAVPDVTAGRLRRPIERPLLFVLFVTFVVRNSVRL